MRRKLDPTLAFLLFFLSSAAWAQIDLSADPIWRGLMLAAGNTAVPPPAHRAESFGNGPKTKCVATASCGAATPVSCSGSGSCVAVDQSCPDEQGYVVCGSVRTDCPVCDVPSEPDCDQFDSGPCDYSWNKRINCCVAPPPEPNFFCPDACFF